MVYTYAPKGSYQQGYAMQVYLDTGKNRHVEPKYNCTLKPLLFRMRKESTRRTWEKTMARISSYLINLGNESEVCDRGLTDSMMLEKPLVGEHVMIRDCQGIEHWYADIARPISFLDPTVSYEDNKGSEYYIEMLEQYKEEDIKEFYDWYIGHRERLLNLHKAREFNLPTYAAKEEEQK